MKGPRLSFAIVLLNIGQDYSAHCHNIMEENFLVLEGEIDIIVDGNANYLRQGDFMHIEPGEVHCCINNYAAPVKLAAMIGPYQENDKIMIEDYSYPEA